MGGLVLLRLLSLAIEPVRMLEIRVGGVKNGQPTLDCSIDATFIAVASSN
jgi:hypothetical protein